MRFAISLLTVICIASVIGTVVKQGEPLNNYVNQFGPFWAELFAQVNLYTVYSAWWFLLILAFLVTSTTLCIVRNAPKIMAELRTYKEHIREQSLLAFHHRAQGVLNESPKAAYERVAALLVEQGWRAKAQVRQPEAGAQAQSGTMFAARKGMANKLGYLAAHSSIVLICVGGLSDGDLMVRLQMALQGKSVFSGGGLITEVPEKHRLAEGSLTYRGNVLVPEGGRQGVALLNMPGGVVLQDLPFDIELKKFIVDYYETGMPKLFASEIIIHDRATGEARPATVKVNEPAFHRGVAIYQSSFDDGGSRLTLRVLPLGGGRAFEVEGRVGEDTALVSEQEKLKLEFAGLKVINVENFSDTTGAGGRGSGADVRKVDLKTSITEHLGTGAKAPGEKTMRNVGPSVTYRLRDESGQAREFHNYMVPFEIDGQMVLLAGVRDSTNEPFRYLRLPVDENNAIDSWMGLRHALLNPQARELAARRYAQQATPPGQPDLQPQIQATALRALALFSGAERPAEGVDRDEAPGGLTALTVFLERSVPEGERARISEVLLRILNGSLFELLNLSRQQAGLAPMAAGEKAQSFMTQAVLSLSDSFFYPAPVMAQLSSFEQKQASVFQVARAPGKTLVYLGSVLLIIGVFAMLYVRERRLWIWIQEGPGGGTKLTAALSTTRKTLDADQEFEQLKAALLKAPEGITT
ncbi:MAG: cytochrome c biogenesis protein ResB [Betaproteobacteria bacterium]|nr:cytochrome c biogenesis protein ResB [Betaproteobacteria bacterium]NBU49884.1 cytochrome c biogenesis protein ResB [Betaproteobacteria bacterium]NBX95712.1 cytochrome c biogenesis protein ResB [Betaproteobacteria bacterium]